MNYHLSEYKQSQAKFFLSKFGFKLSQVRRTISIYVKIRHDPVEWNEVWNGMAEFDNPNPFNQAKTSSKAL